MRSHIGQQERRYGHVALARSRLRRTRDERTAWTNRSTSIPGQRKERFVQAVDSSRRPADFEFLPCGVLELVQGGFDPFVEIVPRFISWVRAVVIENTLNVAHRLH